MTCPTRPSFTASTPAGPVAFCVPTPESVLAAHRHFVDDVTDDVDAGDVGAADFLAELVADAEDPTFGRFEHPVWWIEPERCARDVTGVCTCGRIPLVEVLAWVEDPQVQQAAVDVHREALTAAYAHLHAVEDVLAGTEQLGAVCVTCLTGPHEHRLELVDEVRMLAAELGEAAAHPSARVALGRRPGTDQLGAA